MFCDANSCVRRWRLPRVAELQWSGPCARRCFLVSEEKDPLMSLRIRARTQGEGRDVFEFYWRAWLVKAGIRFFWRQSVERAASSKPRQRLMKTLSFYVEVLKEKYKSLSPQISVLDFFKSSWGTRASPPVLLDTTDGPEDQPALQ